LIYLPTLVGLITLIAITVFLWKRLGPKSGRKLGNEIASYIGIKRSLFYSLLDHGSMDSSRNLLINAKKSGLAVEAATIELAPVLNKGIERLEAHFGEQEMVNDAKPRIRRFLRTQTDKNETPQGPKSDA
jgi:hypothetical protein